MSNWRLENDNFIFNIQEYEDPEDVQAILCSLTDNGIGKQNGINFNIPTSEIYQLSEGQRRLLDLPQESPYYLKIDSQGLVNRPDFKYIPQLYMTKGHGRLRIQGLTLPIVKAISPNGENIEFMVSEPQYKVMTEITQVNAHDFVDSTTNYHSLARIKEVAAKDSRIFFTECA